MHVPVGITGTYTSTEGYQKAAIVVATPESVEPGTSLPQPPEGHVHIAIIGFNDPMHPWLFRPDVPLRATAESIPDYSIEGKLVGFFDPAPAGSISDAEVNLP